MSHQKLLISSLPNNKLMATIETGLMVTVHYTLREGSAEGEQIEETFGGAPLTFKFGVGQMIPGFEAHLKGKSEGDEFSFLLAPGEAYGDINHNAVVEIPKKNFANADGVVDPKVVEIGLPVRMKNQNGQPFQGIIKEISDTIVKVDFNHPMSGKSLHFSGEILEVREDLGLD